MLMERQCHVQVILKCSFVKGNSAIDKNIHFWNYLLPMLLCNAIVRHVHAYKTWFILFANFFLRGLGSWLLNMYNLILIWSTVWQQYKLMLYWNVFGNDLASTSTESWDRVKLISFLMHHSQILHLMNFQKEEERFCD